jgi:hypothetical protein
LGDLKIDVNIIIKWILEKTILGAWSRFVWFNAASRWSHFLTRWRIFGLKCAGNFLTIWDFQESFCTFKLPSYFHNNRATELCKPSECSHHEAQRHDTDQ